MTKGRIALTTVLAGVLLAGTAAVNAAAQPVKIPFDHYLCYKATKTKVKPPPVTLIDEFDEAEKTQENVRPTKATKFCTPVYEKNHEQVLFDPVIHLTRYPFKATAPTKHVEITNQFETVQLKTIAPVELMVPTTKSTEAPPPPPTGEEYSFEHYKCYTLEKLKFTKREVIVTDQFGSHTLLVTARTRLCNPVTKIVAGREFPIRNPERHLVCYTAKPTTKEPLRPVFTNNQFGPDQPVLGTVVELCLPSYKKLLPAANKPRS
jgi:hypothetical protein